MIASLPSVVARRPIQGTAAVLLPFRPDGSADLDGLAAQLVRVHAAGLRPAVNMDTGYVQRLDGAQRLAVLDLARATLGGTPFVAGAFVDDDGSPLADRYRRAMDEVEARGGTPILFPCPALAALSEPEVVELFAQITRDRRDVLLFELGAMFVPYGRIYSLETFAELVRLPAVSGLKHSSLDRSAEWARLRLRDQLRPGFRIYTGNDLAIDMVTYGSDYLLGLAAFHPEAFARRDQLWAAGDERFFAINDLLQYLGAFAFRPPVPAYRHDAAMFLVRRGIITHDGPPPGAPRRPESDRPVLEDILQRLEEALAS